MKTIINKFLLIIILLFTMYLIIISQEKANNKKNEIKQTLSKKEIKNEQKSPISIEYIKEQNISTRKPNKIINENNITKINHKLKLSTIAITPKKDNRYSLKVILNDSIDLHHTEVSRYNILKVNINNKNKTNVLFLSLNQQYNNYLNNIDFILFDVVLKKEYKCNGYFLEHLELLTEYEINFDLIDNNLYCYKISEKKFKLVSPNLKSKNRSNILEEINNIEKEKKNLSKPNNYPDNRL